MLTVRQQALIAILFAGLTVALTFPQAVRLDAVPYHSDPYFSMWRLGWVAHQIRQAPSHLFEANIFYPAHDTLAYSDAMLLPGVLLAPLFWLGIDAAVIYNVTLLAAMLLSAFTAFLLAHHLTRCVQASVIAGAIYAFAPYRFDHYMHLELQLVFWIPLVLLVMHRLVVRPSRRTGAVLAALMIAQALSCVYATMFVAAYAVFFVPALVWTESATRRHVVGVLVPLTLAASLTAVVVAPYGQAYARAAQTVGTRSRDDVGRYGASLSNYGAAPPMNRLYGSSRSSRSADELFLFPGVLATALAVVGIIAPTSRRRFAYLAGLVIAFELSRGLNGVLYGWLYDHVLPFRALRSPARIGILVNLSLAVLAAYGTTWLLPRLGPWSKICGVALIGLVAAEYASAPPLTPIIRPALVDAWLSRQAPSVIAQMPVASPDTLGQSFDWIYMVQGLGHFQRMVNGYSGYPPASYYAMRDSMEGFPDQRSIEFLRRQRVDYVVLRESGYTSERWSELTAQLRAAPELIFVSAFPSAPHAADLVYKINRCGADTGRTTVPDVGCR